MTPETVIGLHDTTLWQLADLMIELRRSGASGFSGRQRSDLLIADVAGARYCLPCVEWDAAAHSHRAHGDLQRACWQSLRMLARSHPTWGSCRKQIWTTLMMELVHVIMRVTETVNQSCASVLSAMSRPSAPVASSRLATGRHHGVIVTFCSRLTL